MKILHVFIFNCHIKSFIELCAMNQFNLGIIILYLFTVHCALKSSVIGLGNTADIADLSGTGDANRLDLIGDVESSKIFGTAGNDAVYIQGNVTGSGSNNIIDLGAGDDFLLLSGNVSGMMLDGGANDDIYFGTGGTTASGDSYDAFGLDGLVHLGDILGLSGAAAHNAFVGGGNADSIFSVGNANTIKNFESLLVDLTDKNADEMTLDDLLNRMHDLNSGSLNDVQSCILMGDASDTLNAIGADVTSVSGSVTIAGLESHGSFEHYIVNDGGEDVHLYVQNIHVQLV